MQTFPTLVPLIDSKCIINENVSEVKINSGLGKPRAFTLSCAPRAFGASRQTVIAGGRD